MPTSRAVDGRPRDCRSRAAAPASLWKMPRSKPLGITAHRRGRSEEHTSELQSLMRISYAVFCLKKKINKHKQAQQTQKAITQKIRYYRYIREYSRKEI